MADLSIVQTVLRTFYRPCPRSTLKGEVATAAAAIDRLVAVVEKIEQTSRGSALDDLAEGR
jgi:hypothetical protein